MENGERYTHILIFDMNVPLVWPCNNLCREKEDHLCRHRFGYNVKVIGHTGPLQKSGFPDLEVIRHVFNLMRAEERKKDDEQTAVIKEDLRLHADDETRWMLFTYDKNFWDDARKEYVAEGAPIVGRDMEFVSNSYRPPGTIYIKDGVERVGPPKKSQIEQARIRGRRKEWVVCIVNGWLARLDVIVLKGYSDKTSADVQLKNIFERAQKVL